MTSGRIGGLLILGGCGMYLAAGTILGDISPSGVGLRGVGNLMLSASLLLIGFGAAVLSVAGPRPLNARGVRIGLGAVAFGLAALTVSMWIPIPAGSNNLASWPYVITMGIGLLATTIGLLITAAGLATAYTTRWRSGSS